MTWQLRQYTDAFLRELGTYQGWHVADTYLTLIHMRNRPFQYNGVLPNHVGSDYTLYTLLYFFYVWKTPEALAPLPTASPRCRHGRA